MDLLIVFLIGFGASFFSSFMSGGLSTISLTTLTASSYVGTHHAIKLGYERLRLILLITIALFSLKLILGL